MKWSKRPGKVDREKESSVHTLRPFPSQGGWVSLRIGRSVKTPNTAPLLGAAFNHYEALQNHRAGLITYFGQGVSFIHTNTPWSWSSRAENVYPEKA